MEPLPQPPAPPPPPPSWSPRRAPRPGELTAGWRTVFGLGWAGVVLGYAAVWKSGRTLGLSPWWLGPPAEPNLFVVQLLPFVLPVALVVASLRGVRWLPWAGLAAGAVAIGVGLADVGRFRGIAAVELAVAAVGVLVSAASFAGLLRAVAHDEGELIARSLT
jgi:hypothetical protein